MVDRDERDGGKFNSFRDSNAIRMWRTLTLHEELFLIFSTYNRKGYYYLGF